MNLAKSDLILDIRNLTCGYGDKPVLKNFNLQIKTGEIVAITGPNGCGKSTILKSIYQLCKIDSGEILYKDKQLIHKTPEEVKQLGISYFMQKNAIFTNISVKQNLILSLNGTSSAQKSSKIEEIVSSFPEIGKWMNKTAGLLSGGQRQQLSMAMLLCQDADLWILDEPTAGLDKENTNNFINQIKMAKEQKNITILFVEHKKSVINTLSTKIVKF